MKKFKYIISGQGKEEMIWVCAACKKEHMEEILLGKWKLVEMSEGVDVPCDECLAAKPGDSVKNKGADRR